MFNTTFRRIIDVDVIKKLITESDFSKGAQVPVGWPVGVNVVSHASHLNPLGLVNGERRFIVECKGL